MRTESESEVADLILAGPESATQTKLKEFLAEGDTAMRRKEFVIETFEKYLETVCAAIKKHDPNHLGKTLPFIQRPMASDAGTPATPWTQNRGL